MNIILSIVTFCAGWVFAHFFIYLEKRANSTAHRRPLFKTNDGVQMFIGDMYWYIALDKCKIPRVFSKVICDVRDCAKGFSQFSTEEKAEAELVYYYDDRERGEE